MATEDRSLDRIVSPGTVARPISIGPRQAERNQEQEQKEKRRRPRRPSIEETLEDEQASRNDVSDDSQPHIDYHA